MSRSNNTEVKNPAQKFFEWDGENGGFRYYDKEKKERVSVPMPFSFLVLDTLSCIKGYSDADKSGFWSNEIRNTKTDILRVKNKQGTCATGLYEQVIADRNCNGAKYCQSVYIGYYENKDLVIGNISIMGAALSSWIEFRKKNNVFSGAITVKDFTEGKKGKTVYQIPTFTSVAVKEETETKAKALDIELREYFKAYFSRVHEYIGGAIPETESHHGREQQEEAHSYQPQMDAMYGPKNEKKETPVQDDDDLPF